MATLTPIDTLFWPAQSLGEALEVLARRAKLVEAPSGEPAPLVQLSDFQGPILHRWVEQAATRLGIESEAVTATYAEMTTFIQRAAPAILWQPATETDDAHFLLLAGFQLGRVQLVGPDLTTQRLSVDQVSAVLCQRFEASFAGYTESFLVHAGLPQPTRTSAELPLLREMILQEGFGNTTIGNGWIFRPAPEASLWSHARHEKLHIPFVLTILSFLLAQGMILGAWWILGQGTQGGRFEQAWLWAWALLNMSAPLMQTITLTNQNDFAIKGGAIFKRKLLYGTLQLNPDEIRHQGAGQFLGRVMESEMLEALAINGSLAAVVALAMLLVDSVVLALGTGGWIHALLLNLWTLLTFLIVWRYYRVGTEWLTTYRNMTNDLVERMVGHRTRLVQEIPEKWHDEEDQALAHYIRLSKETDRIALILKHVIPRGWLIVGVLAIAYPLATVSGDASKVLISVAGILFAFQALTNFAGVLKASMDALLAWNQVNPLLQAANRPRSLESLVLSDNSQPPTVANKSTAEGTLPQRTAGNVVMARDLVFRYRPNAPAILNQCDLEIATGDRLLLEGPSGGGKSTLASVIAGSNPPEAGLLLLRGFDLHTVGEARWRQRILTVPQFQQNHVFSASLAFNLFMGHRWPPTPEDLAEAEAICAELGLSDLIAQMPSGFEQMIGETGWQLSHGERSRLFIARALLQRADLLILDESFGALDPENMRNAMNSVLNRAPTLLVIAHP